MSQFSVPSSEISQLVQPGDGNANLTITGAATTWQAVSDPDDSKFITLEGDVTQIELANPLVFIDFGMQTLIDPLVNTDHVLRVTLQGIVDQIGVNGASFSIELQAGGNFIAGRSFPLDEPIPVAFTEIVIPLDSTAVDLFRANNGYAGFNVTLTGSISGIFGTAGPWTFDVDTSFIQFECPDGDDNPEIIGDLNFGLHLEADLEPEFITGDLELGLQLNGEIADNSIVGDLNLGLTFDGFDNILGELRLGLQLGSTVIMSADPSGLYTIIPGKRFDTLYARETDETTIDVEIPRPFVKTAFVGG